MAVRFRPIARSGKQPGKQDMVDIDPMQGLAAWKLAVDTVKHTIDLVRGMIPASGGSPEQKQALEKALITASSSTAIAEAELGKAFNYEMCRCSLPPTPMLTVGYFDRATAHGKKLGDPVYECPKCRQNNASPFVYKRVAP